MKFLRTIRDIGYDMVSFLYRRMYSSGNSNIYRSIKIYITKAKIYRLFKYINLLFGSTMMIAVTHKCQCKCEHCGVAFDEKNGQKELNVDEIIKLIDEVVNLGARKIYFFGGEPLLSSDLMFLIKYAKQRKMVTRLDTNGFLLSEKMVKKLKEAGLDKIGISIDSPDENIHDDLRGIKGIYQRAMKGVEFCIDHGITPYISTYATKNNLRNGQLKKLLDIAENMKVEVRILSTIACGNLLKKNDIIFNSEDIEILRSFLKKNYVYWEDISVDSKDNPFTCGFITTTFFYVSAYGDVRPCCYVPVSFGNIRKEPLGEIIKRMRSGEMFKWVSKHRIVDCPMNNIDFRNKFIKLED